MVHVDADKVYGEKEQLHQNAMSCFEQVLEATPHKIVRMNSQAMYSYESLHLERQWLDNQLELINSSSVPIRNVARETYQERWTIKRSGERGQEISLLIAHDLDNDENDYTLYNIKVVLVTV